MNNIFSPKRGRMEDFLNIVEKTGGMETYEKIYILSKVKDIKIE